MDFLLKKSWHPSRIQNVEKVWKAEQQDIAEKQRIMELQRKLEEEREIEELKRLSQAGSKKPRVQRLDWMYEGGVKVTSAQEYLEGKSYEEPKEEAPKTGMGLFQNKQVSAEQDTWNRLREDPLLEMKRQEQKSLEYIKQNPVKMAMIKNKLYEMAKQEKEEKKRKKHDKKEKKHEKKEHKHKKEKRHEKSDRRHSDSRDSDAGERKQDPRETKVVKTGYGLVYPKGAPEKKDSQSKEKRELKELEEIRKDLRLEKHKEWEERDRETRRKREERKQRQSQLRGLSAEERKRKLEEMQSDAQVNETRRDSRLKRHKAEEAKRDEDDDVKGDMASNFLNTMKKKTYSKEGVATLQDRLSRNAHFRYRGNLEEANTFGK